jgi:hypothetical protein
LFVKLYAKHMVSGNFEGNSPGNIPELMLLFLNELNSEPLQSQVDDQTVQEDAQIAAWECLKRNYYPISITHSDLKIALGGGQEAEDKLKHLKRLHVLQDVELTSNMIRFSLDPVAEYLAALHLVRKLGENDEEWQLEFIDRVNQLGTASIQGFLQAMFDCCVAEMENVYIPDFIIPRLREWIKPSMEVSE